MKWKQFEREKLLTIFENKEEVVDIGGTLKLKENNRGVSEMFAYLKDTPARYKVLDVVDTYHPDIVGDIQQLPFADNTVDAYVCMSVLEHVENPIEAFKEMYRTLKPGGYLYVFVPFLFYYHAEKGYYKDYWRFTEDSLTWMARDFSSVQIEPVRGAMGTLINLTPLASLLPNQRKQIDKVGHFLDKILRKSKSKQVSGYNLFAVK